MREQDRCRLVWQLVEYWAERQPNGEALVFEQERLTWRQFEELVDAIALAYIDIGVPQGGCVAMLSMARNEFLPCFLAASKVGAMWVGLSPKFTPNEIELILSDCQPQVLVSLHEYMGKDLSALGREVVQRIPSIRTVLLLGEPVADTASFGEFIGKPRAHLRAELDRRCAEGQPDDPVLLMYTSGSTGRPKGVVHTHTSVLTSASVEARELEIREDARLLVHFPINHVAADVEIGFTGVYAGATVVHMDHFDPAHSLKCIQQERISVLGQVPTMYLMQMATPEWRETDLSCVRKLVWSGASASVSMLNALQAKTQGTSSKLVNAYGSTEVAGIVTYMPHDADDEALLKTVGRPVAPYELRVVDENGRDLPTGEAGELWIRGPVLFKEYLNMPELTASQRTPEGWYRSDDIGWLDARGYLHLAGRKSEMFKTGGENVFPRQIEEVLERHPAVRSAAIIAISDPVFGEVGRAFVMLKPGVQVLAEELKTYCREHLTNYKVPKQFDIRVDFPLLPNGKLDKSALRRSISENSPPS